MNNEKALYNLIKDNGGKLAMHDTDVAIRLGVSKFTIPHYKKRLIRDGFIQTKVKVVDNRPITLYKIVKEYTGEIEW